MSCLFFAARWTPIVLSSEREKKITLLYIKLLKTRIEIVLDGWLGTLN